MSDGMLPPLLLLLRAEGGQLFGELRKARTEAAATAAETEASGSRMEGAWNKAATFGKAALIGVAGAAIALGTVTLHQAGNFQQSMTLLQTGAGEMKSNLGTVSSGVLDMSGKVGISAQELAKDMYGVESASYHGAEGLKVLQAAAEGAKTDGADAAVTADALTTVMKDLGDRGNKAALDMSQMVAAVGQGKMRMETFAGSIHSVLPNASALGLSFAQVAGAEATMTAEGVSADQAAQNLNHTIVKLAAPTAGMTKAMASYGLSASDVAQHLGKRGLTGTLDLLVGTITSHMGPAGLTLRNAFATSQAAAQNAKTMLDKLPPAAQQLAQEWVKGSITVKQFTADSKGLSGPQQNLLTQWLAMQKQASGFSSALKSGSPAAQTFTAALKDMLGDQTGLQVALHLTGDHMQDFKNAVTAINAATPEAGGHVRDWAAVQQNFNQQLDQAKASVEAVGIRIGTALIPYVEKAITVTSAVVGWFERHTTAAKVLGGVIGGVLVVAIGAYIAKLAVAGAATVAQAGRMGLSFAQGAGRIVQGFRSAQVAESAFSGWQGTLGGKLRTVAGAMADTGRSAVTMARTNAVQWAGMVRDWAVGAGKAAMTGVQVAAAWVRMAVVAVGAYASQAAGAVVSAATTAAAWVAANAASIAATGGMVLAIGLLIAAGVWLYKNWDKVWAWIKGATTTAFHWIQAHMQYIVLALGPVVAGAVWLMGHWRQVWSVIQTSAENAWHFIWDRVLHPLVQFGILYVQTEVKIFLAVWNAVWHGVQSAVSAAWSYIKPIIDAISSGLHMVTSAASGIGGAISGAGHSIGGFLGFADGGPVPGPAGAPMLAVVHGGEYVVSRQKMSGRASTPSGVAAAGGGGAGDIETTVNVVVDGQVLYRVVQRQALRRNMRNTTNGLSLH